MIKTVIFDIGNVLTDFNWSGFYKGFGYSDEMVERLGRATVGSPYWHEFDRGLMTDAEIIGKFIESDPEIQADIRRVMANVNGMVTRRDYSIPWIQELKQKGYQVLVLSNYSEKGYHEAGDALDFLPYTDGGILSYRDKVIKPEPEIYRLLIDRYQLTPEECVFLDDTAANLEGAEKFGFHTILFTDRETVLEKLKALGVE